MKRTYLLTVSNITQIWAQTANQFLLTIKKINTASIQQTINVPLYHFQTCMPLVKFMN